MARWFTRFPTMAESRTDFYLLHPGLRGLSVKIRGSRTLDVKAYRGSPGLLSLAGGASGHLQWWEKWSFPLGVPGDPSDEVPGWRAVTKRRRISRFTLADGQLAAADGHQPAGPGCAVELTEVSAGGEAWWSLGCEATGLPGLLRRDLEATAAMVFAQPPPDGAVFSADDSRSFAEWLRLASEGQRA
jgi:hypothetical protein